MCALLACDARHGIELASHRHRQRHASSSRHHGGPLLTRHGQRPSSSILNMVSGDGGGFENGGLDGNDDGGDGKGAKALEYWPGQRLNKPPPPPNPAAMASNLPLQVPRLVIPLYSTAPPHIGAWCLVLGCIERLIRTLPSFLTSVVLLMPYFSPHDSARECASPSWLWE